MTEQAFASVWGLSYADFEFLSRFGAKSQVMLACQLLFVRRHGRFPEGRSELDPDVIEYVADQIGVADDPAYSFSSDTARRQRGDVLDFRGIRRGSERDRVELQSWMVAHFGGRDLPFLIGFHAATSRRFEWVCLFHQTRSWNAWPALLAEIFAMTF